jgi:hypothetical protein
MHTRSGVERAQFIVNAASPDISLNNTDCSWNTTLVSNQSLVSLLQGVLPGVVVEYADYSNICPPEAPQALNRTIESGVIVEYADYGNARMLLTPKDLNDTITSRVIVEYADSGAITGTMVSGDLNGDGKVGLQDLTLLAMAYGAKPGDLKWNLRADIDGTGIVGLSDLTWLASSYGQVYHDP